MRIRSEIPAEETAISGVITAAFREAQHSGGNEAKIVEALRRAGNLTVSLVAKDDDNLIGHVAFSPVTVNGRSGYFGLGPVAVLPDRQRQGIGSALIETGLDQLRVAGARGCVVFGDPAYYHRFGFRADPDFALVGAPADYFLWLPFNDRDPGGEVKYHSAFDSA